MIHNTFVYNIRERKNVHIVIMTSLMLLKPRCCFFVSNYIKYL